MPMQVLLTGPVEGHLSNLYQQAMAQKPHWIICSGSFGAWPDPARMDRASKYHAGKDFSRAYIGALILPPIPTLFIAGPHEDHRFLQERVTAANTEVLANVHYLANGYRTTIGWNKPIRVTGLGRVYSKETYSGKLGKNSRRHYSRRCIERGCPSGPTDILVLYEHPDAPGLRNVIYATRPKLILTAKHPNQIVHTTIQGIPVVTLGRGETELIEM